MSITVKWKGQNLCYNFSSPDWTEKQTLKDLLDLIVADTHLPMENIKLLYSGESSVSLAGMLSTLLPSLTSTPTTSSKPPTTPPGSYILMKDLDKSLGSYGIKSGSKIMMMGDRHAKFPSDGGKSIYSVQQVPSGVVKESEMDKLARFLEVVETDYEKRVCELEKLVALYHDGNNEAVKSKKRTKTNALTLDEWKRIEFKVTQVTELLLQTQLKVDGVLADNDTVRLKRKMATKYISGLDDRVDKVREGLKLTKP